MTKFKCINGWTKESMKSAIRRGNTGKQSKDAKDDHCVYLAPDGNKCAVGCFIPEGDPSFDSQEDAVGLIKEYPHLKYEMPLDIFGLKEMQRVHDNPSSSQDIRISLCNWIDVNCED